MKKLLALIIAMVVVFALASCGDDGKTNESSSTTEELTTVTTEESATTTEESTTETTTEDSTTESETETTTETSVPEAEEVELDVAETPFSKEGTADKWSLQIDNLDADVLADLEANTFTFKVTIGGNTYDVTTYTISDTLLKLESDFAPVIGRTYSDVKVEAYVGENLRYYSETVPAFLNTAGEYNALPTTKPETVTITAPEAGVWQESDAQIRLFATISKEIMAAANNADITWRFFVNGKNYDATALSNVLTSDEYATLTTNLTSKGFVSEKDKAYTIVLEGVLNNEVVYKATTSAVATIGYNSVVNLVVDETLISMYPQEANGQNPWYNGYGKAVVVFETFYINIDKYSELKFFMDGEIMDAAVIDLQAISTYGLTTMGDLCRGIVFDLATFEEGTHEFTGSIYNGTDLYTFSFELEIKSADLEIDTPAIEQAGSKMVLNGDVYGQTFEDLITGKYGWTLVVNGESVIANPSVVKDLDNGYGKYTFDLSNVDIELGETYTVELAITNGRVNIYTYSGELLALKSYLKSTEIVGFDKSDDYDGDFVLFYNMPSQDVTMIGGISGYDWVVVINGETVYNVTPILDESWWGIQFNLEGAGFIPDKNVKYTYEICAYKDGVIQYKTHSTEHTSAKGGVKIACESDVLGTRQFIDGGFKNLVLADGKEIAWKMGRSFALVDGTLAELVIPKSGREVVRTNGQRLGMAIVNAEFKKDQQGTITAYAQWYGDEYYYVEQNFTRPANSLAYNSAEYKNGTLTVEFRETPIYTVDQVIQGQVHDGDTYDFKVKSVTGNTVEFTLVPGKFETKEFYHYLLKFEDSANNVWTVHIPAEDMATHNVPDYVFDAKMELWNADVAIENPTYGSGEEAVTYLSLITSFNNADVWKVYFSNDRYLNDFDWEITITDLVDFPEAPQTRTYKIENMNGISSDSSGKIIFGLEDRGFVPVKGRSYTAVITALKNEKAFASTELTFTSNVGQNEYQTVELALDTLFPSLYPDGMTSPMNFDVVNKKIVALFDNWYVQYNENTEAYVVVNGKLYNAELILDEHVANMTSVDGFFKGAVVSCEDLSELRPNARHELQLILVNVEDTVRRRYVLDAAIETYAALDGTEKVLVSPVTEDIEDLFDFNWNTSLVFEDVVVIDEEDDDVVPTTIEFEVAAPVNVKFYSLVTPAGVNEEFNSLPRAWVLEGFEEATDKWVVISEINESEMVQNALEEYTYPIETDAKYTNYRLIFTEIDGEDVEIAEIILYTKDAPKAYNLYNEGKAEFISGGEGYGGNETGYIFDGKLETKMLTYLSNLISDPIIFKTPEPVFAQKYSLTTGNDNRSNGNRDPGAWNLYGSVTGGDDEYEWVLLDAVTTDTVRNQFKETQFEIDNKGLYQYYKLEFTDVRSGNERVWIQLSRFGFFTADYAEQPELEVISGLTPVSGPKEGHAEGYEKIFDGIMNVSNNKMVINNAETQTPVVFKTEEARTAKYYSFANGGDNETQRRLATSWKLEGSNDNSTWTLIDDQPRPWVNTTNYQESFFEISNPGEYEYYRITFTGNQSGVQLSEVRLWGDRLSADVGNLAINKPVTYSYAHSDANWGWDPAAINDGSLNEIGNANGGYHSKYGTNHSDWVAIELGEGTKFDTVVIYPARESNDGFSPLYTPGMPNAFKIEVSDDADAWTTVYEKYCYDIPAYGPQTFQFASVTAKYVRFVGLSMNQGYNWAMKISEMAVYNKGYVPTVVTTPENIAVSATASSNSSHGSSSSSTWHISKINDGDKYNLNTTASDYGQFVGYHSRAGQDNGIDVHITFDFSSSKEFNQFVIYPSTEKYSIKTTNKDTFYFPPNFEIQVSDDNVNWTTVQSVSDFTLTEYAPVVIDFDLQEAQYARFLILNKQGDIKLSEIEIYNK